MLNQYLKFFVNGGVLGIAAWGLQWLIYKAISSNTAMAYSIATALTYAPLIVVNFLIQRRWIFNSPGLFWRFVVANITIMILVSILSSIFKSGIDQIYGNPWGDRGGFIAAALIGSIPSFMLMRNWVFIKTTLNN
jgi:putative flippase GtrA|uniref:GtrA family protein n=1 Tax=Orrella sp. TaxID=1921583 RepID=UPI0040477D69